MMNLRQFPGSVLFGCDYNAVRSPIAEGLLKQRVGAHVYVDSVGLYHADVDPFAVSVMEGIGVDITRHRSKVFSELVDISFDYVVSLSSAAHKRSAELEWANTSNLLFWQIDDPTTARGNREVIVSAYREVRDSLAGRIDDWLVNSM